MPEPAHLNRRALIGYGGAAGVGAAAGIALGRATEPTGPHNLPVGGGVTRQRYSPWGAHQPGILTPAPAAHQFVVLNLLPATDAAALARLLRVWSASIVALMAGRPTPGDAAPDLAQEAVSLTVTVGFGPKVFELDGLAARRPTGFQAIPPMDHDGLQDRWSGGDLLLIVQADDDTSVAYAVRRLVTDAAPFARRRWTQAGSWRGVDPDGTPVTGRNLFGQLDGSGNPTGEARDTAVWSTDGWLAGGTQLVVRRIQMDLDLWDTVIRDRQEKSVGRRLDTGAPLTGTHEADALDLEATADGAPVIALDAHSRVSHPSQNRGRTMLRRGVNYTHVDEHGTSSAGLIFVAYQASIAEQFIPVQQRLDASDALNEWTKAIGSAVFVVPPGRAEGGYLGQGLFDS